MRHSRTTWWILGLVAVGTILLGLFALVVLSWVGGGPGWMMGGRCPWCGGGRIGPIGLLGLLLLCAGPIGLILLAILVAVLLSGRWGGRDSWLRSRRDVESCPSCGRPVEPDWRICPHCSEGLKE